MSASSTSSLSVSSRLRRLTPLSVEVEAAAAAAATAAALGEMCKPAPPSPNLPSSTGADSNLRCKRDREVDFARPTIFPVAVVNRRKLDRKVDPRLLTLPSLSLLFFFASARCDDAKALGPSRRIMDSLFRVAEVLANSGYISLARSLSSSIVTVDAPV